MKKVLIVTFNMEIGGLENILMSYFRNIDKSIFQIDFVINTHGADSEYIREIKTSGGKVFYINTPGRLGPMKYVSHLKKIITENGPYIAVHSNNEYHGGLVCLSALLAGVDNRICHSHTTSTNKRRNLYLMPIYKLLIKKFSTLNLACSKKAGKFMFYSDFKVLPNAIDVKKYQEVDIERINKLRQKMDLPEDSIILGHIGRFSEEKNQRFLIDIMEKILTIKNNVYLIMLGDGKLRKDIEYYAKSKKTHNQIRFEGFQKNVNEYLNIFNILLLPSFYEGLPVTIIEGQACGVQSLVSSTVTKEVDLGLNLVKFIDINNIDEWIDNIININRPNITNHEILEVFNEKLYNIEAASNLLAAYYLGESKGKGA